MAPEIAAVRGVDWLDTICRRSPKAIAGWPCRQLAGADPGHWAL